MDKASRVWENLYIGPSNLDLMLFEDPMEYNRGVLVGGPFTQGVDRRWDWTRNYGGYHRHRDFFSVHWEVQERDPSCVRLHVEAPSQAIDPFLNGIKQELVTAILASDIADVVRRSGYLYQPGARTSDRAIQRYKSTEPFRVVVNADRHGQTSVERIDLVHAAIGPHVATIIERFASQLDDHFHS